MISDHVITFFIALVALWTLFRWGGLIFMFAALYHAWSDRYGSPSPTLSLRRTSR
jgi:hypothetical protein